MNQDMAYGFTRKLNWQTKSATPRQIRFIGRLYRDLQQTPAQNLVSLTRKAASDLIDELLNKHQISRAFEEQKLVR